MIIYALIRLHKWTDEDKLIRFIHTRCMKWFVVKESASRDHIQGHVEIHHKKNDLDKKQQKNVIDNFRNALKKNQDLHGQKEFSVKQTDGDPACWRYLCKGKGRNTMPDIIMDNLLVLEEKVRLTRDKYYEINDELKASDGKKKWYKIRDFKLPQNIEEKYDKDSRRLWYIKIVMYHDANDLLIPDDYQIKKMIKTYMIKEITDEDQKLKYVESLARQFVETIPP